MFLASASLLLAGLTPLQHRPVTDTASFLTTLGNDTVAVESYRVSPRRLEGDILLRAPRTYRYHYVVEFSANGALDRSTLELTSPDAGSNGRYRSIVTRRGDSLRIALDTNGVQQSVTEAASPSVLPEFTGGFGSDYGLYISFGMYQVLASRLDAPVGQVADLPTFAAFGGKLRTKELVRRSPTETAVDYFRIGWTRLMLDASGRITSVNAQGTTEKTHSIRTPWIDIDSAAKVFARVDNHGHAVGVLSPTASVTARVGQTTITITYSSPRARGRTILGITVPYDTVWRTGANAATEFTVDHPVIIGGQPVPAGTYTLWTLPAHHGAMLIINRQTGQWGTDYDATRDLVRVPLTVAHASKPREDFTIAVTAHGNRGELSLAWGDFIWTVPISSP
jgi:Protein of unknown function (DUF2911)